MDLFLKWVTLETVAFCASVHIGVIGPMSHKRKLRKQGDLLETRETLELIPLLSLDKSLRNHGE